MPIPVEHLLENKSALVKVMASSPLEEAVTLMIEHGYSQLPVVTDECVLGMVTSTSMSRALLFMKSTIGGLSVEDVMVPMKVFRPQDDLFDVLDALRSSEAVLVTDANGQPGNVITDYDTTIYFRRRAEDLMLVEDIETTLKDHIRAVFGSVDEDSRSLREAINGMSNSMDTSRKKCVQALKKFQNMNSVVSNDEALQGLALQAFPLDQKAKSLNDLTLGEFISLVEGDWETFQNVFTVTKASWSQMMGNVRIIRNKLMHFRGGLSISERASLRFCAQWYEFHPVQLAPAEPLQTQDESGSNDFSDDPLNSTMRVTTQFDPLDYETAGEPSAGPLEAATRVEIGHIEASDSTPDAIDSKYAPLAFELERVPRNQDRVDFTFERIEEILRSELPAAARKHRSWWANDSVSHSQSQQWLAANWRVAGINMTAEKVTFARAREREKEYIRFFSGVQKQLDERGGISRFRANPTGLSWLPLEKFPASNSKITMVLAFAHHHRVRLELYIDSGNGEENKHLFDSLLSYRRDIEGALGARLEWERLDNRRASRIALYREGGIDDGEEEQQELTNWAAENAIRFHEIFSPYVERLLN